jgi:D-alanyl-D-alanine carboxypeptidase (penicillin-binding protein 5/6)
VLATPTAQMPPVTGRTPGYQIQSQNPLLTTYAGSLGGKTGFTDAARHTFVTAAARDGRRLVVSVMDTENTPLRAPDQAALLLDWGFAVPAGTAGVGTLVRPGDLVPTAAPTTSHRTVRPDAAGAVAPAATAAFPVVPVTLAVTAVLIVAATLVGRRRAVRPVGTGAGEPGVRRAPARRPAAEPGAGPPPPGGSPSTRP